MPIGFADDDPCGVRGAQICHADRVTLLEMLGMTLQNPAVPIRGFWSELDLDVFDSITCSSDSVSLVVAGGNRSSVPTPLEASRKIAS